MGTEKLDAINFDEFWAGWPQIIPEIPEFLIQELSLMHTLAEDARGRIHDPMWPGNQGVAFGQMIAYQSTAEGIVDALVQGRYWDGFEALVRKYS